ncbi:MAG: hypothetical protein EXX96DRAFT_613705 [Benjaminiella poitrasii]|nr:MAG: hypothetical protein EXX96DRAFT_613705 [Benjaminiella poitrasii]
MNPHALVIGDIDNDNENEFVIGNLNGDLAIFKGHCDDGFPLYVCRGLGTITCIAVGDIRNTGKNSVVVINAEGHAHIFDISSKLSKMNATQKHHISIDDYLKGGRRTSDTSSIQAFRHMMSTNNTDPLTQPPPSNKTPQNRSVPRIHDLGQPNLTLKVPVNVNKILIADIDNDGLNELILARTDRILHAFQLVTPGFDHSVDHLYKGIQTPSVNSSAVSSAAASPSTSSLNLLKKPEDHKFNLLDKNMWVFDGQISSLSMTTSPDRRPLLLVAQPGNTFTIIDQNGQRFNRDMTPQQQNSVQHTTTTLDDEKYLLLKDPSSTDNDASLFDRTNYVVKSWLTLVAENQQEEDENGAVATEIVIGKRRSTDHEVVGMLSMDGKFSIYDLKTQTTSERDLFVTHKLFSLATLDMSYDHHPKQKTMSRAPSSSSSSSSYSSDNDNESIPWSSAEDDDDEDEPGCDLFVACAWNGVTYLIDWSKTTIDDEIKYQLVKFAFEGRVCAFTAGLYAVDQESTNVPCLFYVDFEDQIYVYYDVRIQPGPVAGFIDAIDDDIEEGLDRIMGIESGIEALLTTQQQHQQEEEEDSRIDLGDGWQGIAEDNDVGYTILPNNNEEDTDPLNLADFIHECLYEFHDMKDRMEKEVRQFEQNQLLNRRSRPGEDTGRRLSDLNITIEPPSIVDDDDANSRSLIVDDIGSIMTEEAEAEAARHYENDRQHIESWIEDSLIDSSLFNNNEEEVDKHLTSSLSSSSELASSTSEAETPPVVVAASSSPLL